MKPQHARSLICAIRRTVLGTALGAVVATTVTVISVAVTSGAWAADSFAEVEITVTPLGHHVFMLAGAGGNMALCVGSDGALLVDDEFAPLSAKIAAAVATVSDQPVTYVFNTHYHGDHTGGNENFRQSGGTVLSHANVRRRLAADQFSAMLQRTKKAVEPGFLPDITFTDSLTFFLNEEEIVAFHLPHAHTDGDGAVHFRNANVIHAADVVFYGLYPLIDTAAGGSIDGMIAGVERIIALCDDNTQIIPGHGPLLHRDQLQEYLLMLQGARANVAAEMAKGSDLATVQAATPCAEWDEALGHVWLTSDQFVQSIFDSLTPAPSRN